MSLIISYETARCQCDRKIDFGNGVSTISTERVKCPKTHNTTVPELSRLRSLW
jgi:hypothetical protein